ncbi:MAG: autotransporter outer membrane beta-barrel domain-containing protein [Polyangiaceae bacterium]
MTRLALGIVLGGLVSTAFANAQVTMAPMSPSPSASATGSATPPPSASPPAAAPPPAETKPAPAAPPAPPPAPPGAAPPAPSGSPPPGYYSEPPPGYYPPQAYPPGYYPPGYYPPGYYPQGYPPGYYPEAPPPEPPRSPKPDASEHNHDGFYLRLGFGTGYGRAVAESKDDTTTAVKATYTGWGPAYELLLGGTLAPGFVLGGGFVGQDVAEPDIEVVTGDASVSGSASDSLGIAVVGVFVDWFPDPKAGAHVGAMLGPGEIGFTDDNSNSSSGYGASLFGGYDFWVGSQWSLGPEARIVVVAADHDRLGRQYDDTAFSFELLFSVLYH